MLSNYPEILNQLKKCVRCGQCRSVCPVFEEIPNEYCAPRGRVFLAQMLHYGEVKPSDKVAKHLSTCLMCEACSSDCPSGIPVPKLVALARTHLADQGFSTAKRAIFRDLWTSPAFLRGVATAMWAYQKTGLSAIARKLGLTGLLPGDLPRAERLLGSVPLVSARRQIPHFNAAKGKKRFRVGYFLGCATDLFYPQVARATVQVLTENGCEVVIPKEMRCCGLPQTANGAYPTARQLAIANLETFAQLDVDYIVSDCASCISAIGPHGYGEMLKDTPYAAQAEAFAGKVVELTTFLTKTIEILPPTKPLGLKVTYHDPCHLSKALKITAPPRALIKSLPGVEFVDMSRASTCCGGGGTFVLANYQLSSRILAKKMASLRETGAEILLTQCPMCTMQLAHGIQEHGLKCRVMHPVE
ncbi:MAG TPA: (Fe-S)-binding protein, partial [Bacillota bacterium]|nr:(Fe-S)-binding protein [Bacillota bacterium]